MARLVAPSQFPALATALCRSLAPRLTRRRHALGQPGASCPEEAPRKKNQPHRVILPSSSPAGREAACLAVSGPPAGLCRSLSPRLPRSHDVCRRVGVGRPAEAPVKKNRLHQAGTCGSQRWHSCLTTSLLPAAAAPSAGRERCPLSVISSRASNKQHMGVAGRASVETPLRVTTSRAARGGAP